VSGLGEFKKMWKENHHPDNEVELVKASDVEMLIRLAERNIEQCCRQDNDGEFVDEPSDTDVTLAVVNDEGVYCMECMKTLFENENE
jgi:hypothetical protein